MPNHGQEASRSRFYKIRAIKLNKFILNFIFIVALLCLLFINIVSYRELKSLLGSNKWVIHTYEVIQSIDNVLYSITDMESDQRAFLVTSDQHFLREISATRATLQLNLTQLLEQIKDNPQQKERVMRFTKLIKERENFLTRVTELKMNNKLQTDAGMILFNQGNDVASQVKGLGQEIKSVESTLLQERNQRMTEYIYQTTRLIILGSLFSITFLIFPFLMANFELINRKIIEGKIRDTRSYLRQIIESTNEMIAGINGVGKFQIFNEAYQNHFKRIFGKTISLGMPLNEAFTEVPESTKTLEQIWKASMLGDNSLRTLEFDFENRKYIYELSSCEIKDEKNVAHGIIHTVRDVSSRLEEHAKLQESYKQLEAGMAELQEKNKQISLLVDMSDIMLASASQEELSHIMSKFASQLLGFSSGYLYIMHPSRNYLDKASQWGNPTVQNAVFTPEQCWGLRLGRFHCVDNEKKELLCEHIDWNSSFENLRLCVPLMAQNDIYGLLYIEASDKGFTLKGENRLIITAFAELTALALANVRLRENLRHQSIRDPLTGLYNRRYLEDALFKELHQSERAKQSFAVVMLDLDHFKKINDTYGHDAGDALLKEVGTILNNSVRTGDVISRYGGEEFIIMFHNIDLVQAQSRAEEIRASVSKIQMKYGAQQLGAVSISVGIALYPNDGKDIDTLIEAADKALYWAKRNGRNRVAYFADIKEYL